MRLGEAPEPRHPDGYGPPDEVRPPRLEILQCMKRQWMAAR